MKSEIIKLELITPCMCGGADPQSHAEIRVPSIRGQLRWWFRLLGGFKSWGGMALKKQEDQVFGSAAGKSGSASRLSLHVANIQINNSKNLNDLTTHINLDSSYLLFPLREVKRAIFINNPLPVFELHVGWHGKPEQWHDIQALLTVFGHLGSLGFRSRRALGALSLPTPFPSLSLARALSRFKLPNNLIIKELPDGSYKEMKTVIGALANWLKNWRSHLRNDHARQDHDAGCNRHGGPVYRPALGLPIVQSKWGKEWHYDWDRSCNRGKNRFASPIILRPYRDGRGQWRALILFIEGRRWPQHRPVYINGVSRPVKMDLYSAMKKNLPDFKP